MRFGVIHVFVWVMRRQELFDQEVIMAKVKKSLLGTAFIESIPKKTRQGSGQHTKYAATSSNKAKKRYRGQGR